MTVLAGLRAVMYSPIALVGPGDVFTAALTGATARPGLSTTADAEALTTSLSHDTALVDSVLPPATATAQVALSIGPTGNT
jgi:hypothetical protein